MLETQWILLSWRPCSRGLRQRGQTVEIKLSETDIYKAEERWQEMLFSLPYRRLTLLLKPPRLPIAAQ